MALVLRPRAAARTGIILSVVLVAATVVGWVLLPAAIQVTFTVPQRATLAFFVLVMVAIMMAVALSIVRTSPEGLLVRNGVRTHWIAWEQVRGFRFTTHDPWAYVLLVGEPDSRPLLAVQRTDGDRAEADVARLRAAWDEALAARSE